MKAKTLIPIILTSVVVIAMAIILFFTLSSGEDYSGTVTYNGKGLKDVSVSDG